MEGGVCSAEARLALATGLLTPAPIMAQADARATAETEIVVTGSRDQIRRELSGLLGPTGGQLARFEDPLCPHIAGCDAEYSGYLR